MLLLTVPQHCNMSSTNKRRAFLSTLLCSHFSFWLHSLSSHPLQCQQILITKNPMKFSFFLTIYNPPPFILLTPLLPKPTKCLNWVNPTPKTCTFPSLTSFSSSHVSNFLKHNPPWSQFPPTSPTTAGSLPSPSPSAPSSSPSS